MMMMMVVMIMTAMVMVMMMTMVMMMMMMMKDAQHKQPPTNHQRSTPTANFITAARWRAFRKAHQTGLGDKFVVVVFRRWFVGGCLRLASLPALMVVGGTIA